MEELSYVIITPHSIRKSRTGGIIARLLSRTGLDLARARMFAPSRELVSRYAETIGVDPEPRHRAAQEVLKKYLLEKFSPDASGYRPRVLFLVFRGENAVEKIRNAVGHIVNERTSGETIRDTYGDYVTDREGHCIYFEPAALAPQDGEAATRDLKLWAEFSESDGGLLDSVVQFPPDSNVQKTLVLIKPDLFRFPSARPGGVIDLFSRTGLYIVAAKLHSMSVAQAEEFYGPVLDVLKDKLREPYGARARLAIENEFGYPLTDDIQKQLGNLLGPGAGRKNWEDIVKFMSGIRPSECPAEHRTEPGTEKCLALVYQGVDAVRKIREVLGPTDPSKAPPGSIRKEFGQTIMVNAAHASDAPENAEREMKIIKITENNFRELIDSHFGKGPKRR